MKGKGLLFVFLISNFIYAQEFTDLRGDYFGQIPSGDLAVIFAPGIVSTDDQEHAVPAISPDGKNLFFTRDDKIHNLEDLYWVSSGITDELKKKTKQ